MADDLLPLERGWRSALRFYAHRLLFLLLWCLACGIVLVVQLMLLVEK